MENKEITKQNKNIIKDFLLNVNKLSEDQYKQFWDTAVNFREYSICNQMLLYYSGASQVAGFHKWKSMGRNIKQGSKAIWILAPMPFKTTKTNENGATEEVIINYFKSVPVFDISATEGKEILKGLTTSTELSLSDALNLAKRFNVTIDKKPLEIATGGYISHNSIVLNSNLNEIENTGTLLHELSHFVLGHTGANDSKERNIKEIEAETLTYLLCNKFNVKRKCEFYVKGYMKDEKQVMNSFKAINEAFNKIMGVMV